MKLPVKTKGSARLFKSPVLEVLTTSNPVESSITSVLISVICIYLGFRWSPGYPDWLAVAVFLSGILSWSFFEYVLHRYLFHLAEDAFSGSGRLTYLLHGVHHEYPNDANRTLMPFVPKLIFSLLFFGIFYFIFGKNGPFFSSGFLIGYYLYSMLHFAIHRFKAPAAFRFLWKHHHLHHHLHDDRAFGVSSRLWDRVFGTMPPEYEERKNIRAGA